MILPSLVSDMSLLEAVVQAQAQVDSASSAVREAKQAKEATDTRAEQLKSLLSVAGAETKALLRRFLAAELQVRHGP